MLSPQRPIANGHLNRFHLFGFFLVLFFTLIVRTAWIGDDAAITLRSVMNWINGYGPVFNVGERVQAYTHPLWFFLVSGFTLIIQNVFFAAIFCSIVCSLLAMALLVFRISKSTEWGLVGIVALILSKAFMDYSASGLENPLSFLLIAIFTFLLTREHVNDENKFKGFSILFALMFLTRPDLVLFIFPAQVYLMWKIRKPLVLVKLALPGFMLFMAWILFSTFYYGYPLPNTAYAKLGISLHWSQLIQQGWQFYLDSLSRDPVTLLVICFALLLGYNRQNISTLLISVGLSLYLLYILKIGGDFMSGRFFSVSIFAAVSILVLQPKPNWIIPGALITTLTLIGFGVPASTLLTDSNYEVSEISHTGIADERGFYFQQRGLISGDRFRYRDLPSWRLKKGKSTPSEVKVRCGRLGYKSIYDGPSVHYIDYCALADPLLARLPAKFRKKWRVGHYARHLPVKYESSVKSRKNQLVDRDLAKFYDKVLLITRGDLWSWERLKTIVAMNLGAYDSLINYERYKGAPRSKAKLSELSRRKPNGSPWNDVDNILIAKNQPLEIDVGEVLLLGHTLDISVDHNDGYELMLLSGERTLWSQRIRPLSTHTSSGSRRRGMHNQSLRIPANVELASVDKIILKVVTGDNAQSVGHLIFRR